MEDKQIQEQIEEQYSVLFTYLSGLIAPAILFITYFLMGGTPKSGVLVFIFGAFYLCFMLLRLGPCPLTTTMSSFLTLFWVMAMVQSTGNEQGFIIFIIGILVLALSLFYSMMADEERYMFWNYFFSLIIFVLIYHYGRLYI